MTPLQTSLSLQPIAFALDTLQGEKKTGVMLFPSILNIEYVLKQKQKTTYCDGVITLILMRLRESFAYVFDWDTKINEALPYIMATMTTPVQHPCFAYDVLQALAKELLLKEVLSLSVEPAEPDRQVEDVEKHDTRL